MSVTKIQNTDDKSNNKRKHWQINNSQEEEEYLYYMSQSDFDDFYDDYSDPETLNKEEISLAKSKKEVASTDLIVISDDSDDDDDKSFDTDPELSKWKSDDVFLYALHTSLSEILTSITKYMDQKAKDTEILGNNIKRTSKLRKTNTVNNTSKTQASSISSASLSLQLSTSTSATNAANGMKPFNKIDKDKKADVSNKTVSNPT